MFNLDEHARIILLKKNSFILFLYYSTVLVSASTHKYTHSLSLTDPPSPFFSFHSREPDLVMF